MTRQLKTCRSECIGSPRRAGIVTNEPRVFKEGTSAVKGRAFMATDFCDRPECLPARTREVERFTGEPVQVLRSGEGGVK